MSDPFRDRPDDPMFYHAGTVSGTLIERQKAKILSLRERLAQAERRNEQHAIAYNEVATSLAAAERELERWRAIDKHLPKGFAIGDDATVDLAVRLANTESTVARLTGALKLRAVHQSLIETYDRVHHELSKGKAWTEINDGLRAPKSSYEAWLSYMQSRLNSALRTIAHETREALASVPSQPSPLDPDSEAS